MEPAKNRIKLTPQEFSIMDLPNEILEMIFLKLSMQYIQQNIALVCKRFQEITRTENFVKRIELISKENLEYDLRDQIDERVLERLKRFLKYILNVELSYLTNYQSNIVNTYLGTDG